MAVTKNLPIGQWYTDTTSEWTLDYPPLFAWLERVLAEGAVLLEPRMVRLQAEPFQSALCVGYQRGTVILLDSVLVAATLAYALTWPMLSTSSEELPFSGRKLLIVVGITVLNAGLLIVDHVHFQYNGVLLGVLVASLAAFRSGRFVLGGGLFATLLMMKHLFLALAPLVFVYLLAAYCLQPSLTTSVARIAQLGGVVLGVFAVALGPFALTTGPADNATEYAGAVSALRQIASRLFPFGRGLTHSYWAPNVWALVTASDLTLAKAVGPWIERLTRGGIPFSHWVSPVALSSTRGLLGGSQRLFLFPAVEPWATALLSLAAMVPALWAVARHPSTHRLSLGMAHCALASFLFGWHVHEKAVLVPFVLLALLACDSKHDASRFLFMLPPALVSLWPLLFGAEDRMLAVVLTAAFHGAAAAVLNKFFGVDGHTSITRELSQLQWAYTAGTYLVGLLWAVWPLLFASGSPNVGEGQVWMPFAPLMLVSVWCSLGLLWAFVDITMAVCTRQDLAHLKTE
jgi:alpha-1,3-glucosyltransferase